MLETWFLVEWSDVNISHIRLESIYASFIWGKVEFLIRSGPDHPACFVCFLGSSNPRSVTHLCSKTSHPSTPCVSSCMSRVVSPLVVAGTSEQEWSLGERLYAIKLRAVDYFDYWISDTPVFFLMILLLDAFRHWVYDDGSWFDKTTPFSDSTEALWSVGVCETPQFLSIDMKYGVSRSPLNFTQDFLIFFVDILRCCNLIIIEIIGTLS